LGKGEEWLPYLSSSKAMEEMVEKYAGVEPPLPKNQKAVDYSGHSYKYFSSLSHEMQKKPRLENP
jgi:hypothetical protein